MRSSSGYALLEGFRHLFKRLANEPALFPTDVNNLLILVANSFSWGASLLTNRVFRHLPNMNCADFRIRHQYLF
jgi:hypothetical protein